MKRTLVLIATAFLALGAFDRPASAANVSVDVFYDSLQPYGDWLQTADYGYVWHPRDVAENWRPYTVGNWAYTDAGWTWVSEEPFGWATYHYGRWANVEDAGWVWVPEKEWGPAWVSWRTSDKYVGWAPLPPEARFDEGTGIQTWADTYYDIGPESYSFMETRQLGAPRLAAVLLPPRENVTVITETRNITNISYNKTMVFNTGPEFDLVSRQTAQPIRRLRLERQQDIAFQRGHTEAFRSTVEGNTLRIAAPQVTLASQAAPAKVSRQLQTVRVNRGWQGVQHADQLRAQIQKSSPKAPASLPAQPKFDRAATAAAGTQNPANPTNPASAATRTANDRAENEKAANGAASTAGATPERTPGNPAKADRNGATAARDRKGATSPTAAVPEENKNPAESSTNPTADRSQTKRTNDRGGERKGAAPEAAIPEAKPATENATPGRNRTTPAEDERSEGAKANAADRRGNNPRNEAAVPSAGERNGASATESKRERNEGNAAQAAARSEAETKRKGEARTPEASVAPSERETPTRGADSARPVNPSAERTERSKDAGRPERPESRPERPEASARPEAAAPRGAGAPAATAQRGNAEAGKTKKGEKPPGTEAATER